MSCVDSNNGKKRHLPPWMLRSEPEVKVDDSEAVENAACKPKSTAQAKEKRATKTKRQSCENESEKAESSLPKRSETQRSRSRRELDKKHKVGDAGMDGSVREKETYAPPKKKRKLKALKGTSSDNAVEESARSEEEELTVEDLVSIAKEHINNAMTDGKLSSEIVGRCNGPSPSTNISEDEQIYIQCDDGSSVRYCSKSTASDLLENQPNDSKSITGSPSKKTRDPTQDILELLLGPVYKSI